MKVVNNLCKAQQDITIKAGDFIIPKITVHNGYLVTEAPGKKLRMLLIDRDGIPSYSGTFSEDYTSEQLVDNCNRLLGNNNWVLVPSDRVELVIK